MWEVDAYLEPSRPWRLRGQTDAAVLLLQGLTALPSDGHHLGDAAMGPARADTMIQRCHLVLCSLFFLTHLCILFMRGKYRGRKHDFSLLGIGTTSCFACLDGGHGPPPPALLAWMRAVEHHHPMELHEDHMWPKHTLLLFLQVQKNPEIHGGAPRGIIFQCRAWE